MLSSPLLQQNSHSPALDKHQLGSLQQKQMQSVAIRNDPSYNLFIQKQKGHVHMERQRLNALAMEMLHYYANDPARSQHLIKVHAFSKLIAQQEGLDSHTCDLLEAAAYVHDIGIKPAEAKYHSTAGPYQEELGAPIALDLLTRLGFPAPVAQRVAYLVGHHHTYDHIDGMDYQILVEADFLVNLYEDFQGDEALRRTSAQTALDRIFVTKTGKQLCKEMFGL
jgi:HD superfamily phosphodiesterase